MFPYAYSLLLLAAAATPAIFAQTEVVVYQNLSPNYDVSSTSVSTVTCAALLNPPYKTFGELPYFPYLAGASFISEGGTAECGSCWQLTSANGTINVVLINHADNGFDVGHTAFNDLTDHGAFLYSSVNATATQLDASVCGL
ncbi:hypothetical protein EVJ58_g10078 [Rhodofomes roseus]|nr:hypothetical protein EVJ58_g10078 [Rhodofomes roseus]